MEIVIIVYIGLIGLLIGSFLNVVIYRLPHGETIVSGRSHCPVCGHNLSGLDLVPVFSFLLLGRRCRYCKAPISWRYMIVELTVGLFFTGAAIVLKPWSGLTDAILTASVCALFCVLLADSLIQYDGYSGLTVRMAIIALVFSAISISVGLDRAWPVLIAGLALNLLTWALAKAKPSSQAAVWLRRLLPFLVLISFSAVLIITFWRR